MKQTEVQEGGIYVSKGRGMRANKRVRVVKIIPQVEGPPRIQLVDLETGRNTYPKAPSFQQSYVPERLPQAVPNQLARRPDREVEMVSLKAEIKDLKEAFRKLVEALGEREKP